MSKQHSLTVGSTIPSLVLRKLDAENQLQDFPLTTDVPLGTHHAVLTARKQFEKTAPTLTRHGTQSQRSTPLINTAHSAALSTTT